MRKLILVLVMAITVIACKKNNTAPNNPPANPVNPPAPEIKTVANFTIESSNGFPQTYANFNYVQGINNNAGKVSVNGFTMNLPYVYNSPSMVSVTSPVIWNIQGGVVSGTTAIPAETITCKNLPGMPVSADIDTSKTVDANFDYTINSQPFNCDSVVYRISPTITKTSIGSVNSVTFKSAELKGASYGIVAGGGKNVMVSISAYNSYVVKVGDYNWRFISKATNTQYLHFKS